MPARTLNILFATPRFFPAQGGVENHVYQVATRLVRQGHGATVYTTDDNGALPAHGEIEGVQIHRFPHMPRGSDAFFAPSLHNAIVQHGSGFDALHVQNYLTFVAPLAMAGAARIGLPYTVTFHGGGHSQSWRNVIRRAQGLLLRPLLMRAHKLIATARFEVDYYGQRLKLPRDKFAYVSNGCDIAVRALDVRKPEHPLVISIGRLERYKGHQHVLRAFPHVLKRQPDARLRLLGDGPYRPELERLTSELGLGAAVEVGGVPIAERQRMAELLSSASLVVLFSEFETQPMAALEAIALGCQTLVADTSGLSELAAQGFAKATPYDAAPDVLAAAIVEHMRAGANGKPAALKLPTWDDCTNALMDLYSDMRAPRARREAAA